MRRLLCLMLLTAACQNEGVAVIPEAEAGTDASGDALALDECAADHAAFWTVHPPAECSGTRTCVDAHRRFWGNGQPFIPRGVYNGGIEYLQVLSNCPMGAPCQATTPANVTAYVNVLGAAGINLIMDRSNLLPQEMLDAIHANPVVGIAHLLWTDPFTQPNHDSIVADIVLALADPDVMIWFGPDELDFNDLWAEGAGIRRLLRGSSPALDALLAGPYMPTDPNPYLPAFEPMHDTLGLPFEAALYSPEGLAQGTNVYDVLMPETYAITSVSSPVGTGPMGTERIPPLTAQAPVMPVLQIVGIEGEGLAQPSAGQVRAQIASALANGATGEFLYNLVSNEPMLLGRSGWYAPDAVDAWAALSATHALEDSLVPVLFSDAVDVFGKQGDAEWRTWTLGSRTVVWIVNPTDADASFDLDTVAVMPGYAARDFTTCGALPSTILDVPAYEVQVVELLYQ